MEYSATIKDLETGALSIMHGFAATETEIRNRAEAFNGSQKTKLITSVSRSLNGTIIWRPESTTMN